MEDKEDTEVLTKETQDYASPKAGENMRENQEQDEMVPGSTDASMEDNAKSDGRAEDLDLQSKGGTSPNISCSSDLVSGTPQKPNSRRQSFIMLEKYSEGKPASPGIASTFTGPLIKTSNNQERSNTNDTYSSLASQTSTDPNTQDSLSTRTGKVNSHCPGNNALESPLRPKQTGTKCEPVRLTARMPNNATEEDDVIPDTQTEVEEKESKKMASTLNELKPSNQEEEESQQTLDDSQTSVTKTSPGEPRRSGRYRVRPLLPGEDPEEREEKCMQIKRRRSGEDLKSDSPKSSLVQSGPKTRSRQAVEEDHGKDRSRMRAQRDQNESSQTNSQGRGHKKIKLYSNSEEFLDKPEPKRRSTRESSQTDLQSDYESQSQGRHSRRSKALLETKEEGEMKKKVLTDNEESSQTATLELVEQTEKDDDEPKKDSQIITPSPQTSGKAQEFEFVEQTEKDDEKPKKDSQMIPCSPETGGQSQEFECIEKTKKEKDSQIVASSPTIDKSLDRTSPINKLINESEVRDKHKTTEGTDESLSQEDSQMSALSSSDSQSLRRSRRSKALSKAAESEEKSKNTISSERRSRSNSQVALSAASHAEATIGGRTRGSNAEEVQSNSSPLSTPENSQSLNVAGSTESSLGRGRYSRRRSSQALVAKIESSESESSAPKENIPMPKKRGRKPRAFLQSHLTLESKEDDVVKNDCDIMQKADAQSIECKNATNFDESQMTPNFQGSESLHVTTKKRSKEESQTEVESDAVVEKNTNTNEGKPLCVSPQKEEQRQKDSNIDNTALQETDTRDLQTAERLESVGINAEQAQEKLPCDPSLLSGEDTLSPAVETTERLQSSEEKTEEMSEPGDSVVEKQNYDSDHQEHPVGPVEDMAEVSYSTSFGENQLECSNAIDDFSKEEEQSASIREGKSPNQHTEASDDTTPLQEIDKDSKTQTVECRDEEETKTTNTENDLDAALTDVCNASVLPESTSKDVVQGSPAKKKDLDTVMGPDVGQSPSSSRSRGTWSPSASPSTSILKKGQKRPLEDETPSPLVKVSDKADVEYTCICL